MNPKLLGFLRSVGSVAIVAVLTWLGDIAHLSEFVSLPLATLISGAALAAEHAIEANGKGALFGAVQSPTIGARL